MQAARSSPTGVRQEGSRCSGGLLDLLTDNASLSMPPMPPMPLEYVGRELAGRFIGQFIGLFFASGRRYRLLETQANGQPALGVYVLAADRNYHATGLVVIAIHGRRVSALTRIESAYLSAFGLPRWLPG